MSSVSSLNSLLSSSSASDASSSIDLSSILAAATGATSTGIDVTSAVDAAIYAAQAPERQWEAQQSTLKSQVSAVNGIQTALSSVSSDLNSLHDPYGPLTARTVSSSDSSAVTATAQAGTVPGNHVITVSNLAQAASWYSTPLASPEAALGSSTLTITQSGGASTSFSLGTGDLTSLTSLATAINNAGLGVTANIITDANGARLALVGQNTGSAANFSVIDGPYTGSTWTSGDVASASSGLAASSFQVADGSTNATISVTAGETLGDVANQINGQGLNLTASVVTDSSGTHLAVSSTNNGNVTVSSDPSMVMTQASAGVNASLTVDGVPVNSATNTVQGAISGVTLQLAGNTGSSQVSLAVTADTTQITNALSQFVTDYNTAASAVNTQFEFNSSSGSQGVLGSDATMRSLQSTLLSLASYVAPQSTGTTGTPIRTLADLGISMNNDGTLSLDADTLDQAVASNASGVQDFFQGASLNGFASTTSAALNVFSDPSSGALTADLNSMSQLYNSLQTDVNNYESGYIASQRSMLTTMYSNAEIALQQLPTQMKELQAQLGGNSGS